MVRLNLTEAAKAAKVSRSTLYRHIREGRISRTFNNNDEPEIDTSELIRVYGSLEQRYSPIEQPVGHRETLDETAQLEHEIEILRLKLAHAEALRKEAEEAKKQWRDQAERLTLLITDQRNTADKMLRSDRFQKFMKKIIVKDRGSDAKF